MNQSYYHQLNNSLTPVKNNQNNLTQLLLKINNQIRNSTENQKCDSLLDILIQSKQKEIQSYRQHRIEKSQNNSSLSPQLQNKITFVLSQLSYINRNKEQSQQIGTQFDKLLNKNTSLLLKIQELEQKNSLLQMKCQSSLKQGLLAKYQNINYNIQLLLQKMRNNENENRILKELINRQTCLMHIPSVLHTLSLIK